MPADDINKRIIEVVDLYLPDDTSFTTAQVTQYVQNHLHTEHPELLKEWREAMEFDHLRDFVTRIRGGRRRLARRRARNLIFVQATIEGANGEDYRPLLWDQPYAVNSNGLLKPLRMTSRDENLYIASAYHRQAKHNRLNGIFHQKIAAKLTADETVEDVFQPSDIDLLYATTYETGDSQ